MNTRILMQASTVFMGAVGLCCIFMPQELVSYASTVPVPMAVIGVQITGALYFGFAMLNWTARANLIGGIYSRPVAIGNLTHFMIGALALLKLVLAGERAVPVLAATAIYCAFAIAFAIVFFGGGQSPKSADQQA
jgi:hypothetical protein